MINEYWTCVLWTDDGYIKQPRGEINDSKPDMTVKTLSKSSNISPKPKATQTLESFPIIKNIFTWATVSSNYANHSSLQEGIDMYTSRPRHE